MQDRKREVEHLMNAFEHAFAVWLEGVQTESQAAAHGESPDSADAFRLLGERHPRIPPEFALMLRGVSFAVAATAQEAMRLTRGEVRPD